ncbi:hypothetical protein C8R45DRAFT_943211 [Mycena sanguinolenta]|nr:hypothetical protein C8R45DRAFT_943211 [Mycena sanguinolenta]
MVVSSRNTAGPGPEEEEEEGIPISISISREQGAGNGNGNEIFNKQTTAGAWSVEYCSVAGAGNKEGREERRKEAIATAWGRYCSAGRWDTATAPARVRESGGAGKVKRSVDQARVGERCSPSRECRNTARAWKEEEIEIGLNYNSLAVGRVLLPLVPRTRNRIRVRTRPVTVLRAKVERLRIQPCPGQREHRPTRGTETQTPKVDKTEASSVARTASANNGPEFECCNTARAWDEGRHIQGRKTKKKTARVRCGYCGGGILLGGGGTRTSRWGWSRTVPGIETETERVHGHGAQVVARRNKLESSRARAKVDRVIDRMGRRGPRQWAGSDNDYRKPNLAQTQTQTPDEKRETEAGQRQCGKQFEAALDADSTTSQPKDFTCVHMRQVWVWAGARWRVGERGGSADPEKSAVLVRSCLSVCTRSEYNSESKRYARWNISSGLALNKIRLEHVEKEDEYAYEKYEEKRSQAGNRPTQGLARTQGGHNNSAYARGDSVSQVLENGHPE